MKKFLSKKIWLVLLLGLVMRLVVINQSFWLDEAIGVLEARDSSFSQIAFEFPKVDNHPPFYYLLLKTWSVIFGLSEVSVRLLSVFFGLLTIVFVFLIAKSLWLKDKLAPFLSALFIATSPFHIYFSQEARMYAMTAFFASTSIYFFLKTLKDSAKSRTTSWTLFSISITFLIFTDYLPVFMLPVFAVWGFLKKKNKKWWVNYFLSHTPLLVLGLLWFPILFQQAQRGSWLVKTLPSWLRVAGGANIKQLILVWMKFTLGRISLDNKLVYYFLVTITSIPFLFVIASAWKKRRKNIIIWLWLVVPLFLGFLASLIFPAFIYFRFVFVIPAFYLVLAEGISSIRNVKIRQVFIYCLVLVNILGWSIYILNPSQHREDWREAVGLIESRVRKNEIVLFEYPFVFAPYGFYNKGIVDARGATDSISADSDETKEKTFNLIQDKSGVYYFEYLWDLTDPGKVVETAIESDGFVKKEIFDFNGVGQVIYWTK